MSIDTHSESSVTKVDASIVAKVKRGPESWNYIYVALGFVLSIEGTVVSMIPLRFPINLATYIFASIGTAFVFIKSGGFQNWLLALKAKYEDKYR